MLLLLLLLLLAISKEEEERKAEWEEEEVLKKEMVVLNTMDRPPEGGIGILGGHGLASMEEEGAPLPGLGLNLIILGEAGRVEVVVVCFCRKRRRPRRLRRVARPISRRRPPVGSRAGPAAPPPSSLGGAISRGGFGTRPKMKTWRIVKNAESVQ